MTVKSWCRLDGRMIQRAHAGVDDEFEIHFPLDSLSRFRCSEQSQCVQTYAIRLINNNRDKFSQRYAELHLVYHVQGYAATRKYAYNHCAY